jgi:redox-sensitive bicupin YhaK (pirin superfamily)
LDEFRTDNPDDYVAGFPDHPHRGFETVTYMLEGNMEHRDHGGNHGILRDGAVQWMTAGRGIIHSEMPKQTAGKMHGFQMWVNLPAKKKMVPPRYQDYQPEQIPVVTTDDAKIKIMAGSYQGTDGAVSGITSAPLYMDVSLKSGKKLELDVDNDHTAWMYVIEGKGVFGSDEVAAGQSHLIVFEEQGNKLLVQAPKDVDCRVLVAAAKPLKEPMKRYGPFVMSTEKELQIAFQDFQLGKFQPYVGPPFYDNDGNLVDKQ